MPSPNAVVVLEDGLILPARSAGAPGTRIGEMVFTTSMSGYQEAVTDPSYLGQILCFAAPMIGNYGTGPEYCESDRVWPEAVIMRVAGDLPGAAGPTGWKRWLTDQGVVAVDDCDTRRLVRHLRGHGAMRGGVSTDLEADELLGLVRSAPTLDGRDLSVEAAGPRRSLGTDGPVVVAIDCGMKRSIGSELALAGARVEVVGPATSYADVLAKAPQALFVSNGPGDPAAVTGVVELIRRLLGELPVFGICLGHQLLARALDLPTAKLPFGHRGANHPVQRTDDGRVEVTVQNHGYAVQIPSGGRDGVEVTRRSLFDGSVEGIAAPELRAWSVQYHPEARPGPNDASYLFADFVERIS
jgi:carbamoyl-phosphate synthase small subunit